MTTCPTCHGAKVLRGVACPGFRVVEIACFDCGGAGEVSDLRAIWARGGEQLKASRACRDMSLREAAEWIGVTPKEWSDAEFGRIDPAPLRARVSDKALARFRRDA